MAKSTITRLRAWLEFAGAKSSWSGRRRHSGLYLEIGDAFVERLIGEFAVAIWDPRRRMSSCA
jgi:hypothetical protein